MDIINFKIWLERQGNNKKVQSDIVSRIKKLEKELGNCDIDDEYKKDKCDKIINALKHKGINPIMSSYGNVNLPIGRYTLSTYRYSLNIYLNYLKETK